MDPNNITVQLYLSLNKFNVLINQYSNAVTSKNKEHTEFNKRISNFLRIHFLSTLRDFTRNILDLDFVRKNDAQKLVFQDSTYIDCFFHWWLSLLNLLTNNNKTQSINTHLSSELISVLLECISRIMTLSSSIVFHLEQKDLSNMTESKIAFQHRLLLTIHFTTNNLRLIKKYRKTFFANNEKSSKKDGMSKYNSKYSAIIPSGQPSNIQYPPRALPHQHPKIALSTESLSQISQSNSSLSSAPSSFKTINGSRWKWYEKLEKYLHQWVGKLIAYSLYHLSVSKTDFYVENKPQNTTNKDFSFDLLFFNQLFPYSVIKTENHEYEFIANKDVFNDPSSGQQEASKDYNKHRLAHLKTVIEEALPALKILLSYLGNTPYFMSFYYHYLFINFYHLNLFDCSKFFGFHLLQRYIGSKLDADFVAIMKRNGGNNSTNAENTMNAVATSAAGSNSNSTQDKVFETDELFFRKTFLFKLYDTILELPCNEFSQCNLLFKYHECVVLEHIKRIPAHNITLSNYIYQHFLLHKLNNLQSCCPSKLRIIDWKAWLSGICNMWQTLNCEVQIIAVCSLFNIWCFLPIEHQNNLIDEICQHYWDLLFTNQKFHCVTITFCKFLVFQNISLEFDQIAVKLKELQEINLLYYNANPDFFAKSLVSFNQTNDFLLIPGFKKFILFPSANNKFLQKSEQYPFDVFDELLEKLKPSSTEMSVTMNSKNNGNDKMLPPTPDANSVADKNNASNSLGTMLSFLSFTKAANSSSSTQPPQVPDKNGLAVSTKKRLPSPPELKLYREHYQASLENPISIFQNVSIFTKSSAISAVKTPIQMVMHANQKWGVNSNLCNSASQTLLPSSRNNTSQKHFDKKPLPAINKTANTSQKIAPKLSSPPPPLPPKAYFHSNNASGMSTDSYMEFTQFMKSDTLLDNFKFDTLSSLPSFESSTGLANGHSTDDMHASKEHAINATEGAALGMPQIQKNELFLHQDFFGQESDQHNVSSVTSEETCSSKDFQRDLLLRTKICQTRKLVATLNQTLEEYRSILPAERSSPTFILYNTPQRKNVVTLPTV
ncbi:hypothetical protein ACO0RG_002054 [Hanseniaspora osmophila]